MKTVKYLLRGLVYLCGFCVFAFGTALSIKSALGVTAVTSLPLALSQITGFTVGQFMAVMAVIYVTTQILLLRKKFKLINVGQVAIGLLIGSLVDLFSTALRFYTPSAYPERLALTLISLPIISLGLSLIINANFLPTPAEGFSLALAKTLDKPFPRIKVITDSITLALAVGLSLLFTHNIVGIREGTLIDALFIGVFIGLFNRLFKPFYTYINTMPEDTPAKEETPEVVSVPVGPAVNGTTG